MSFLFSAEMLDHRLPKTMQIFTLMRDAIIAMRLPPGEVIQEKEIAAQLGLSIVKRFWLLQVRISSLSGQTRALLSAPST